MPLLMAGELSDSVVWLVTVFLMCLLSGTIGYYLAYRVYSQHNVSRISREEEQLTATPASQQCDFCFVEVGFTSTVAKFHNPRKPCHQLSTLRKRGITKSLGPCRLCYSAKEE